MKHVAFYARVSMSGGDQNPEMQLAEMRALEPSKGWTGAVEYVDHGVSGTLTSRPALDRMLADCRAGKVSIVVVWKLDRLGRSLQHLLSMLDELRERGVDFVSLRDSGIDSTTAAGRLMLQLLGAFAEFERNMIVERTQAGMDALRAAGKLAGTAPMGRMALDDGTLVANPRTAQAAKRAKRLHGQGLGYGTIAKTLNGEGFRSQADGLFTASTVKRYLAWKVAS